MSDNITATPEFTLVLHIILFVCSFIGKLIEDRANKTLIFQVGYAIKPVLNTSRFEVIKSEFSSRETVLKEQLRSAEGEKYDIEDQIKKLDNVTVRYQKEFPRLKTNVEALDDQIKVLDFWHMTTCIEKFSFKFEK